MVDILQLIKNGVFKSKSVTKDDAFWSKIHLKHEQGADSTGPKHYSPQRPIFRNNKLGSMKRIIKATQSSRQMMREVSGLGMIDPVHGVEEEVADPQHPSFIFNDMDITAIPEDMRDVLSCYSDHTANEKDGLDMEKFQQTLSPDSQDRPQAWQSCVTTLSSRNFGNSKQRELPCAQVIFEDTKGKSEVRSMPDALPDLPELTTVSSQSTNPETFSLDKSSCSRSKTPTKTRGDPSNRNTMRSPRRTASYRRSPRKMRSYRQSPKKASNHHQRPVSTVDTCVGVGQQLPSAPLDLPDGKVSTPCTPEQAPSAQNCPVPNGQFKTPPKKRTEGCHSSPTKPQGADYRPKTPVKTQAKDCRSRTPTKSCHPNKSTKAQERDRRSRTPPKIQQHTCSPKTPPNYRVRPSPKKIASSKVPKNSKRPDQPPASSDASFDGKQMSLLPLNQCIGNNIESKSKSKSSASSYSKSPLKLRRQLSRKELGRPSPRRAASRRNNSPRKALPKSPHQSSTSNSIISGDYEHQELPLVPLDNGAFRPRASSPVRIPVRVVARSKSPTKGRSMSPRKRSRQNINKTDSYSQPAPSLSPVK